MTTIETQTDIEYTYECPICMDECLKLKDLNVLDCGHFVCRPCGVKASTAGGVHYNKYEIKKIPCPMCRKESIITITMKETDILEELKGLFNNTEQKLYVGTGVRYMLELVHQWMETNAYNVDGSNAWEQVAQKLNDTNTSDSVRQAITRNIRYAIDRIKNWIREQSQSQHLQLLHEMNISPDPVVGNRETNQNGLGHIFYNPYIIGLMRCFTRELVTDLIIATTERGEFNLLKFRALVKAHFHYQDKTRPKCVNKNCETKSGTSRYCRRHRNINIPCCIRCLECGFCNEIELRPQVIKMLSEPNYQANSILCRHAIIYPNPQN